MSKLFWGRNYRTKYEQKHALAIYRIVEHSNQPIDTFDDNQPFDDLSGLSFMQSSWNFNS